LASDTKEACLAIFSEKMAYYFEKMEEYSLPLAKMYG